MTHFRESDPEAGLLRMLREALRAGLRDGADDEAFAMARSSAQIIGLRGLEAGLDALEPHRGRPWSGAARELVDFVERLVAEDGLPAFRASEHDLLARAEALREWRAPAISGTSRGGAADAGGGVGGDDGAEAMPRADEGPAGEEEIQPPPGSMTVADALAELPLGGDPATQRASGVLLTPQVGTALRAALEWMGGDSERSRPFRRRAEDSVLEVICEGVQGDSLAAAHDVLAAAAGNLAPLGEVSARSMPGAWLVRVPAWSARPVHLMLEQGELRLAVPWHAVLRLSMVPSIEIELRGGSLATPVLAPLVPLLEGVGERPVVAIAHGLKRALLVADRLVWRLGAEACEPPGPAPAPELFRTVRSVEGEVFWVADPGVLLSDLAVPNLPARVLDPGAPPQRPRERTAPFVETPPAAEPLSGTPEAPIVLGAGDVEPIALTVADVEPLELAVAAAFETEAPRPNLLPDWIERFGTTGGPSRTGSAGDAPPVLAAGARNVLVAEDSIAARHFLSRLFEQRGFSVHAVDSAAALRAALASRTWSLACIDLELPDASGRALMDEARAAFGSLEVPLVALVRDDEDAELAAASGVSRWLRKPFDRDEVDHLLSRLGLLEEKRS